jgi:hypothetical protein
MNTGYPGEDALKRQLDGELRLVHEAILLVAAHGAPRVLVAGLRLGAQILGPARRLADGAGVRLVPLWTADGERLDIRIEAVPA